MLMGTLGEGKLQEVHQGLVLSSANALFEVFPWTLPLGIQGRDRWAKQDREPRAVGCVCSLAVRSIWQHLNCSSLLEVGRKAHISGTNSPTFNLDVELGTVNVSGSSGSQNWVETVSKSSSYTASVTNVHHSGTKRSHCHQSLPSPRSPSGFYWLLT